MTDLSAIPERTATHESGHGVTAEVLGLRVDVIVLQNFQDEGAGALIRISETVGAAASMLRSDSVRVPDGFGRQREYSRL
jgi:hypothetical protein